MWIKNNSSVAIAFVLFVLLALSSCLPKGPSESGVNVS
jgi:hypothetical protein